MTENIENKIKRPPIVVVLGHIDHGKSSLLEKIREDLVITSKEAGGITQHIGAYEVEVNGKKITFLDTPGHEAFFGIRKRSSKIADIGILVIDATEGVKEQTKEAYLAAKENNLPLIVALNKIDKPNAQPEIVKNQLAEIGLLVEDRGGTVPAVNISAKTGQGIDTLLDLIFLLAEMENLETDLSKKAKGVVIETCLDEKRGNIATVILKEGALKENAIIATKTALAKVRALEDFQGKRISEALPSQPVVVLGFEECPIVGEEFQEFESLEEAKSQIEPLKKRIISLPEVKEGEKILKIILKADVLGSLEAIEGIIEKIPQEKVKIAILKADVGNVNIDDLRLADENQAKILAFRVKPDSQAQNILKLKKIQIKSFQIIYELIEEIRREVERMLEPEIKRVDLGKIKIIAIFKQSKGRQIIGGRVLEGEIEKGSLAEIFRGEDKIGQGKIISLQIEKKNIDKAQKGREVGILIETQTKINLDDLLLIYKEEKQKKEIFLK